MSVKSTIKCDEAPILFAGYDKLLNMRGLRSILQKILLVILSSDRPFNCMMNLILITWYSVQFNRPSPRSTNLVKGVDAFDKYFIVVLLPLYSPRSLRTMSFASVTDSLLHVGLDAFDLSTHFQNVDCSLLSAGHAIH